MLRLLVVIALALSGPQDTGAAENGDKPTVAQSTYNALAEAQKQTSSGEYAKAIERLNDLLADVKGKAYEEALAQQALGYAHAGDEDYKSAARAFQQALDSGTLPGKDSRDITYNLAQILINDEQYQQGLKYLEDWMKGERSPSHDARVLAAVGYYQSGNCEAAIPHLNALAAEAKDGSEQWSQALLGCYVEAKQYDRAAAVLERAVRSNPANNDNWMQLAAAYQQAEQTDKAIAVLELMLRRGALDEERIVNLARMYLADGVPYKAARLLEEQMQADALARSEENLELLLDSLLLAQEQENATQVARDLIALRPSGERYYRLGRIYFDLQRWPEAIATLDSALQRKDLAERPAANLLLGIAAVHSNQQTVAERSLTIAAADKDMRAQAQWWLQRLQRASLSDDADTAPEG
jgi:tetratricopeptide (TPR) repeat protein